MLTKQEQFFYDNAGYSYDGTQTPEEGHIVSAQKLAEAETKALELGFMYDWESDDCIGCECESEDCPCYTKEDHVSLACVLYDADCQLLDSLGSICCPTLTYKRVVQAELALENISIGQIQVEE